MNRVYAVDIIRRFQMSLQLLRIDVRRREEGPSEGDTPYTTTDTLTHRVFVWPKMKLKVRPDGVRDPVFPYSKYSLTVTASVRSLPHSLARSCTMWLPLKQLRIVLVENTV